MNRAFLALLLALPTMASAQEHPNADTAAWNRFHAYEAHVLEQPVRAGSAAALDEYRLVWVEHNNGYFTSVAAGDSTTTLQTMDPGSIRMHPCTMNDVTFYGDRFAVYVCDIPVGMLDLTRRFFERSTDQAPDPR